MNQASAQASSTHRASIALGLTFCLLATSATSGCLSALDSDSDPLGPEPSLNNTVPLEYTYIRIGQDRHSGPGLNYEGSVEFPYCLTNPNDFNIVAQDGYEIYHVVGAPISPELRLVKEWDSGAADFPAHWISIPIAMSHAVLVNETVDGGSTNYAVHIWNQILIPEPIHRQDLWFNMTFIPYGPRSTVYEQGEPC